VVNFFSRTYRILIIAFVGASVVTAWFAIKKTSAPLEVVEYGTQTASLEPGLHLETNRNAEAVFQRAFWRAPTPEDEILHAERREWVSDDDGVRRWQWFLAVKPGQTLNDWLRQENPFLTSAIDPGDYQPPTSSPSWFPSPAILARSEIQRHGANGITLIFDTHENHLYATDSGGGFRQSDHD